MVPLSLIRAALLTVDVDSFEEVQAAVLMLMLLFTFARTETPCPKTVDGFDEDQHLQVRDVKPEGPVFRLNVRLKRIKQDQRLERPEAKGEGDWIWIGDTPDDAIFSIKLWTHRLFRLHGGAREQVSPFFIAPSDRARPLTYDSGMRHVRKLWAKASSDEEAKRYGLHGLRVTGYTLAKRGAGEALAVAQGGWKSEAHERYERFSLTQVLSLPAAIVAAGGVVDAEAAALPQTPVVPAQPVPGPLASPTPVPVRDLPGSTTRTRGGRGRELLPTARSGKSLARAPHPISYDNAVSRRVLVPASLWPAYACREHGGDGWEGKISKVRTTRSSQEQQGLVEFVARKNSGAGWKPVWLPLDRLRPLI
jgi:hypothetical protein